ncbi:MAG: polysaccharide deacetylase family protein [Vicinamibacteria bacterium]|jgi:peptidoglycan/xylan/chitin deacetylase (PgdA/CDA1 family)|nr:polysaccharide deacetylase family protein [Vicinamibacteria bacterium]
MPERRLVLSIDLDEWYHCRWATGSPRARFHDTRSLFAAYYQSDRPSGEIIAPTRRILGFLDRENIRATFFVLGEMAEYYPDLIREIAALGHEIGCHGYHHVDIDLLGEVGFERELVAARERLSPLVAAPIEGYRAPNLLLRDYMIPILRRQGFRYDASVCTARSVLGKDFGHRHVVQNPYRFSARFEQRDERGDMVEIPLPVFPLLRLPAATGIMTRILGWRYTWFALRHALQRGDAQYYFHPYELGARPRLRLRLKERLFLRRLGPYMENSLARLVASLRRAGVQFVTARDLAGQILRGPESAR